MTLEFCSAAPFSYLQFRSSLHCHSVSITSQKKTSFLMHVDYLFVSYSIDHWSLINLSFMSIKAIYVYCSVLHPPTAQNIVCFVVFTKPSSSTRRTARTWGDDKESHLLEPRVRSEPSLDFVTMFSFYIMQQGVSSPDNQNIYHWRLKNIMPVHQLQV